MNGPDEGVGGHRMRGRHQARSRRWASAPLMPFCHHAQLYDGEAEYLELVVDFVREGTRSGDHVLVLAAAARLSSLRSALAPLPARVRLTDAAAVGANPARLIPLWREFLDSLGPDDRARGVAEPVSGSSGDAVRAERAIHESLLNRAFGDDRPFWLVCPYAAAGSDEQLEGQLGSNHAVVTRDGEAPRPAVPHRSVEAEDRSLPPARELAPPSPGAERLTVDRAGMAALRRRVRARGDAAGLDAARGADFALAVHEVVANSVRHGGGAGRVALWEEGGALLCQVEDGGRFDAPLAGRVRPSVEDGGGRGLWMANQLCDLVQIRSFPDGTVVRLHSSI